MRPSRMLYLYRKGHTLRQIAGMSGKSKYHVHRAITAERWRTGEVVISEKALREHLREGLTIRQVADLYFCSASCVHYKIKKYGLKTRPPGNPKWVSD